jgi:uncharacterized protein YcaQ
VLRRERGVRVYAVTPPFDEVPTRERLRRLILLVASVLAPVPERTLRANIARFRALGDPKTELADLTRQGELEAHIFGGERYLHCSGPWAEPRDEVRLLAPFDPVVWDRRRFEQLWGWRYRFEAYTPVAKRVRGYYALPLLFRDRVIGWANVDGDGVQVGFAEKRPRDPVFRRELDAEIDRLRKFL